ncbi:MAG: ribbon-helix-helix domain-containing protein [Oscillospiraceae bacterium]|nr:ribbon-helix-helix domain-containing protein [Oscillospiraceae bacterium]
MGGVYRNRVQWSTATDKELLEKFRQLSADTRIPASRLLDEAIEDLLVKYQVIDPSEKKNP